MSSASVLALGTVMTLLALTVASETSTVLQLGVRTVNQHVAQDLAESAAALAVRELVHNQGFGRPDTPGWDRVFRAELPEEPTASGLVTFEPVTAERLKVAPSYNNFGRDAPHDGYGRAVPKQSAQIVATGCYRGSTAVIEQILFAPTFDHVISCAGPIQTTGDTLIARVRPGARFSSLDQICAYDLLPGAVGSRSSDANAIKLGGRTTVKGDAEAAGQVVVQDEARVEGRISNRASNVPVPRLNFEQYEPAANQVVESLAEPQIGPETVVGFVRRAGPLTVVGGLNLGQAVLYVDGDLHVNGPITGKGAIFCKGDVTVGAGSAMTSDNLVALAATGNVTLQGEGRSSFFRGIVYTEGDFEANQINVLGALATNTRPSPAPGQPAPSLKLHDASVIVQRLPALSVDVPIVFRQNRWYPADGSEPQPIPGFQGGSSTIVAGGVPGIPGADLDGAVYDEGTGQVVVYPMDDNGNVLGGGTLLGTVKADPTETVSQALAAGHTRPVVIDFNRLVNPADRLRIIQWRRLP